VRKLTCFAVIILFTVSSFCSATPESIRIALIAPLSGEYAAYGIQLLSGATQAIDDINKRGGIKGVSLELMPLDDQCNPDLAVNLAEQLVQEKQTQIVIGHACSAASLATAKLYAKANILVITPSATNPQITQRGIPTIFRMVGTDNLQSNIAASFLVQKLQSKRIAILHDEDLYSQGLADTLSENLIHLNNTPVLYQAIPRGTRNFKPLAKKLKQLQVDALYFAGLYPEVSALAKALHVLQIQVPLIAGDGVAVQEFVSLAGGMQTANAVLFSFATDPKQLVSTKTVMQRMHKANLDTFGYAMYAYAAAQVIAAAIEQVNSTDGTKLAAWLHQHEVDTVLGKKSWDTNGDIIAAEFKMYCWDKNSQMEKL